MQEGQKNVFAIPNSSEYFGIFPNQKKKNLHSELVVNPTTT